jgi:hypothetical protein
LKFTTLASGKNVFAQVDSQLWEAFSLTKFQKSQQSFKTKRKSPDDQKYYFDKKDDAGNSVTTIPADLFHFRAKLIEIFLNTLVLGQVINRIEGAKVADVTKAVRTFAAQKTVPSRTTSPRVETACEVSSVKKTDPLDVRLKKLVTASRCQ